MKTLRVLDPRIARQNKEVIVVVDGPSSVTFQTVSPSDQTSTSPSFVIQTPSPNAGISRTLRLHARGTLTITGVNLDGWKTAPALALRQNALQSTMQNCSASINDLTVSLGSLYLMANPLATIGNTSASMKQSQSGGASRPDVYSEYISDVGADTIFGCIGDGPYGDALVNGRTAQIISITYTGTTSVAVVYEIYENLLLSPLEYTNSTSKSLYGVNVLTLNVSYGQPHRMLSWAPVAGAAGALSVTSVSNAFSAQDITVSYVVAYDSSLVHLPLKNTYDLTSVQYFSTTAGGSYAPGAAINVNVNAVEFAVVPSRLLIYVTASATDLNDVTQSIPDFCCAVTNVSIVFGTRAGLLSGAHAFDLWDMYRANGGLLPYPVWAGQRAITSQSPPPGGVRAYAGGPLIIDVASDLSLPSGVCPGLAQRIQFAMTGNFVNQTAETWNNLRVVVVAITPGILNIKDGSSMSMQGNGLSLEQIAKAPIAGIMETKQLVKNRTSSGYGGSFWDDFTSGISSVANTVAGVAKTAAPFLPLVMGGAPMGGAPMGGAPMGGRRMTKAQMARY